MEITVIYIISQIITVAYFGVLTLSYLLQNRLKILVTNFIAHVGQTISMAMLNGYTGAAMSLIMTIMDLVLLVQENRKIKGRKVSEKFDLIVLVVTVIVVIFLTVFTYNGFLSLMSVIATLITTVSLWQKNVKTYKILGIIANILWLIYNTFIMSIMGVVLESILLIASIIGYIKDSKNEKNISEVE